MRQIRLQRTDLAQDTEVTLVTEGSTHETIVGRGTALGCDDKRVSRNHCSLRILPDGGILLVAIHANPCFYKVQCQSENFHILSRNESQTLYHGDEFSLLPDSYRYRISRNQEENFNDGSLKLEAIGNPLDLPPVIFSAEEGNNEVSANTDWLVKVPVQTATAIPSTSTNKVTSSERILPDWLTNLPQSNVTPPLSKARKRGMEQQQNQMDKKQKNSFNERCKDGILLDQTIIMSEETPSVNDNVSITATTETRIAGGSPLPQLGHEPDQATNTPASSKDGYEASWGDGGLNTVKIEPDIENIKTEPKVENVKTETVENLDPVTEEPVDSTSDPNQGASSSSTNAAYHTTMPAARDMCMYGAACYRQNQQHRTDLSHPGDADYDAAAEGLPECEYGTSCYRKNVQHRKDFKHTKKMSPLPRTRPSPQTYNTARPGDTSDEDEYDLNDSFLNDASSDDYQPSGSSDSEADSDRVDNSQADDQPSPEKKKKPKGRREK